MPFRYYICPIAGDGDSIATGYRAKAADTLKGVGQAGIYAAWNKGVDGRPTKTWCICAINVPDLSLVDADSTIVDIFEKLSDAAGGTKAQVETWLKNHVVGDVPAAARTRIQNRLTAVGVSVAGITLATPLWDVLLRVFRAHDAASALERLGV